MEPFSNPDPTGATEHSMEACFQTFTVREILSLVEQVVKLPRAAKRNRNVLFETFALFPPETRATLKALAIANTGTKWKASAQSRKRRRIDLEAPTAVDTEILDGPSFKPSPSKEVTAK
ncbi:hypothetical protein MSAN_01829700 [Mycena sanguinolenta]|uniref:Uncharacterized protein n=1 Tax=Mycena sanguinolenta TaxID=230812 RepID=A0A8H6XRU1_9AGAR|nr:hypothetical protein MSAN_01829700 [Mycena sanguinolenta]